MYRPPRRGLVPLSPFGMAPKKTTKKAESRAKPHGKGEAQPTIESQEEPTVPDQDKAGQAGPSTQCELGWDDNPILNNVGPTGGITGSSEIGCKYPSDISCIVVFIEFLMTLLTFGLHFYL